MVGERPYLKLFWVNLSVPGGQEVGDGDRPWKHYGSGSKPCHDHCGAQSQLRNLARDFWKATAGHASSMN
jgi:hypothetical protein